MKASHALSVILPVFIAFLMLSPVNAAPGLSVGSQVSYRVAGTVTSSQNCTSANITVGGIACGNNQQQFPFPPVVSVQDDGRCTVTGDSSCRFSPNNVNVSVGFGVSWRDDGNSSSHDTVRHTVTSDTGLFDFNFPFFNQTFIVIGQPFNGPTSSFTFSSAGTFLYHCKIHTWMTGKVVVTTPTIPPAKVQSYSLSGTVGWTSMDLDDNAQLKIAHSIDVFNASSSSSPKILSDSGTSEETVSLADRKDTSSPASPFSFLYGFQTGPGPGFNPFPSFGYNSYGNGYYGYTPLESYTLWWMNGPLTATSTVELLTLQAGVRGTQTANLGSSLGSKEAWIVSTEYSQQSSQLVPISQYSNYYSGSNYGFPGYYGGYYGGPQQSYFNSAQSNSLNLSLLYGKQSDLLLTFSSSTKSFNEQTNRFPAGSFLYGPFGGQGFRVSSQVDVIRTFTNELALTLTLDSTSLDLSKRMTLPAPSTSNPAGSGTPGSNASPATGNSMFASPLWLYGTVGIVAGLIVSGAVWGMLRLRHRVGAPNIGTATSPTSQG